MIVLIGHLHVKPESLAEALEACSENRTYARTEKGCESFDFFASPEDPLHLVFVEKWASREDLQSHFDGPAFTAFVSAAERVATEPPAAEIYSVSGVETF